MTIARFPIHVFGTWMRPDVAASPTARSMEPKPENEYCVALIISLLLGSNCIILYRHNIMYNYILRGKCMKHDHADNGEVQA